VIISLTDDDCLIKLLDELLFRV